MAENSSQAGCVVRSKVPGQLLIDPVVNLFCHTEKQFLQLE